MEDRILRELRSRVEMLEGRLARAEGHRAARPRGRLGKLASNRRVRLGVVAVGIVIATASYAATISVPFAFTNGTIADANQVNANFDTLVVESNDQDTRISALDAGANAHQADSEAHHTKTKDFTEMIGQIGDAQIPAAIARDSELAWPNLLGIPAGFADGVDDDSGGTITAVNAGSGLTGGGTSGSVTLSLDPGALSGLARVIPVSADGSDLANGTALRNAIAGIVDASASTPYVVRLGPGVFDLGATALTGKNFVDVEGAGRGVTTLTATAAVTFDAASSMELRDLRIVNAAAGTAAGIQMIGEGGTRVSRVDVSVPNATTRTGIQITSSSDIRLTEADVDLPDGTGVSIATGTNVRVRDSRIVATTGSGIKVLTIGTATISGSHVEGTAGVSLNTNISAVTLGVDRSSIVGTFGFAIGPVAPGASSTAAVQNSRIEGSVLNPAGGSSARHILSCVDSAGGDGRPLGSGCTNSAVSADLFTGDEFTAATEMTTPVLHITGGADLAERFDVSSAGLEPGSGRIAGVAPGSVVCIDPAHPGALRECSRAVDPRVAGVVSGAGGVSPGMLMGQRGSAADGVHPVALSGRVYVRSDGSGGAIEPGDLLTTSHRPGHARRVRDGERAQGAILGKAMTPLDGGEGLVLLLVGLQ